MSLARRELELHAVQTLLRELRQESGLKQQDLAVRLGLPQSFISKYEAGTRRLDICELRRVLTAMDIPLTDFLSRLDERVVALTSN